MSEIQPAKVVIFSQLRIVLEIILLNEGFFVPLQAISVETHGRASP